MKCRGLVLWQPYAWAMFHGKNVENRDYALKPGPLVVVAGKTRSTYSAAATVMLAKGLVAPPVAHLSFGGIVGVVDWETWCRPLTRCHPGCYPRSIAT